MVSESWANGELLNHVSTLFSYSHFYVTVAGGKSKGKTNLSMLRGVLAEGRCQNFLGHTLETFLGSLANQSHRTETLGEACSLAVAVVECISANVADESNRFHWCSSSEEENYHEIR